MKRPSITIPAVIHLFAAAHVAVAVLSRIFNYVDDVPLTVLTLSMILIISVRRGLRVELVATLALICIFVAYLFGIYGARFFEQLLGCGIAAPAITTAIVTELIGWLTYAFARSRNPQTSRRMQWSPSTQQIVVSVAAILLFRIFYTSLFSSPYFEQQGIYPEFYRLLGNTLALMTMFCGNIIFVNQRARLFRRRGLRLAASALFTLGFVLLLTAAVYFGLPQGNGAALSARHFFRLYTVVLLVDIVVYAMLQLAVYVIESHRELRSERGKKHRALFHYDRLKQQINPHFLFNSLNILDYLVQERHTERASSFIRKLAEIYRYMLRTEQQPLVRLEEELDFAGMYIDLLKERFVDGLAVDNRIDPSLLSAYIVPCSLQLLIENATKHNIVSAEEPLRIELSTTGRTLSVVNNLQPRTSIHPSTGLGLANIRQQYADITSREIEITKTDSQFIVKLPLV